MFLKKYEGLFLLVFLCTNISCPENLAAQENYASQHQISSSLSLLSTITENNNSLRFSNQISSSLESSNDSPESHSKSNLIMNQNDHNFYSPTPTLKLTTETNQQNYVLSSSETFSLSNMLNKKNENQSIKVLSLKKLSNKLCLKSSFFDAIVTSKIERFKRCSISKNKCDGRKVLISSEKNVSSQQAESTVTNQTTIGAKSAIDVALPSQATNIPSFEEWRRRISLLEKSNLNINPPLLEPPEPEPIREAASSSAANTNLNNSIRISTNRARNFASHECGAKIADFNGAAEFVNRVLNEQMDEYMLNPCDTKNWFVIELCETIQPQYLELANYELYSSVPKEFSVFASEHYPNRIEWSLLGNFYADDVRSLQGFKLQNNGFVKFVKIQLHSYYGSEHYCPISLIRIFGTSLFDEVERIDNPESKTIGFSNDESETNAVFEETLKKDSINTQKIPNPDIFGKAKNAVFNIVKKALNLTMFNRFISKENLSSLNDSNVEIDLKIQSKVFKLYSFFKKIMISCEQYFFLNITSKNVNMSQKCIFYRTLFNDHIFRLMYHQYLSQKFIQADLFFQSSNLTQTLSSLNANTSEAPLIPLVTVSNISNDKISTIFSEKINATSWFHISESSINSNVSIKPSKIQTTLVDAMTSTQILLPAVSLLVPPESFVQNTDSIMKTVPHQELFNNTTSNSSADYIKQEIVSPINILENSNENDAHLLSSFSGQSKEAVIIRLTNRIKNLERNISLMSTYLENLSRRYRMQMEEMLMIFNNTIDHLNSSAIVAAEKDIKQQEQISKLEKRISLLDNRLNNVLDEVNQHQWLFMKIHIMFMVFEFALVAFLCLIFYINLRRNFEILLQSRNSPSENSSQIDNVERSILESCSKQNTKTIYISKSLLDLKSSTSLNQVFTVHQQFEENQTHNDSIDEKNSSLFEFNNVEDDNQHLNEDDGNKENFVLETPSEMLPLQASSPCLEPNNNIEDVDSIDSDFIASIATPTSSLSSAQGSEKKILKVIN